MMRLGFRLEYKLSMLAFSCRFKQINQVSGVPYSVKETTNYDLAVRPDQEYVLRWLYFFLPVPNQEVAK